MSKYHLSISAVFIPMPEVGSPNHCYTGILKAPVNKLTFTGDSLQKEEKSEKLSYTQNEILWEKCVSAGYAPQHLHIISDRYPQLGDYVTNGKEVNRIDVEPTGVFANVWKIEASTDKTLGLSAVPKDFIETIIKRDGSNPVYYIKFNSGGYANAMHMDSGTPPDEPKVCVDENNQIIFVAPCESYDLQKAAIEYSIKETQDIKDTALGFMLRLAAEAAFIAGAKFEKKYSR